VQFAGFTIGKSASAYSTPWHSANGNNNTSALLGGHDNATGVANINYTWQFGNGVSAQLGVAEPKTTLAGNSYYRGILINASTAFGNGQVASGAYTNNYAGNGAPDIQGNIRVDQAAFTAQLSAAAHQIRGGYYNGALGGAFAATGVETDGHPTDAWGFAIAGGLQLKNLPTGPGDKLTLDVGFAEGANKYILSGTFGNSYGLTGGASNPGSYQGIASATNADGVFVTGGSIEKTRAFGVRAGYIHNWNQYWESDLFGSYSKVDYNANASAAYCNNFAAGRATGNGFSCNPDFAIWQIGTRLGWTPVQNLTFSAELAYTALDQSNTGSMTLPAGSITSKPAATYDFKDLGTFHGNLRVRRTF